MKFIGNFSLYLIGVMIGLLIGSVLFKSNVSILTWVISIGFGFVYALLSNQYKGKHDE